MRTRTALVTGATRGIGRALVPELRARGYRVIATGRDLDALSAAFSDTLDVETALVDIASPNVDAQIADALGGRPLHLLLLNAARFAPWDETASGADPGAARDVMETNLFGSWRVIQAALPAIREARGAILGIGSGAGSHGDPTFGLTVNPGAASYAVSKAAFHALLHRLSAELASDGVRVWVTDPGLTATSPGMEDYGARPVADGAASVLAPLDRGLPSGTFTRDGMPLPW